MAFSSNMIQAQHGFSPGRAPGGPRNHLIEIDKPKVKPALKALYRDRWQVELDIRNIKTTLGMETLSCCTPEMAEKELWVYLLAYNLIRLLMAQAVLLADVIPRQPGFCIHREIKKTHCEVKETHGSPGMVAALNNRGIGCCENTVARLMRENGIRAKMDRRYKPRQWKPGSVIKKAMMVRVYPMKYRLQILPI